MKLTEHFSLEEFTYSSTALARGIDNHVPKSLIPNIKNLCEQILDPLRAHIQEPVIISSGYRSPQLNKLVGGSPTSQHMTGEACDIHLSDQKKLREWFTWIMDNCNFDQLILERSSPSKGDKRGSHWWIHVSCKYDTNDNRHQVIQGMIKTR